MSILVVGSVGIDTIITPAGKAENVLGGSASHFSLAASFFGLVWLVGIVGTDFPKEHLESFRARGIDLEALDVVPGETFRWTGRYPEHFHGRDTLEIHLNVFKDFAPRLPESRRDPKIVFLANIDPELQLHVLSQIEKTRLVVGDTMNFWLATKRDRVIEAIKKMDVFLVNDEEARDLCATRSILEAGRKLQALGPKVVVIKMGEHGAALFHESSIFLAPAYPLTAIVDPTGAGDSFAGGFVGHLARVRQLTPLAFRRAVVYGSIMGSYNVVDFSAHRLLRLEKEEIDHRYREFEQLTRF
ncbi:MAG: sugar kinase [Candidatus Riflebacteria bacterium]|nr:sugar kinase [Candidatus Riflebacteria bacterium]